MTEDLSTITAIHLDAVGGVAGDMFVAALIDAVPGIEARVLADAAAVLPEGMKARVVHAQGQAIRARMFGLEGEVRHGEASHAELSRRIAAAELAPGTAANAQAILDILAEAEARIHGVAVEAVHFHEIGDWDSLLDVLAAGSIAAALAHVAWSVSPLPLGSGLVKTRHGLLPVPAPATSLILEGFPWRDDGVAGERVTPTGAAILKHLKPHAAPSGGTLRASGTGTGTRHLPGLPNILRALVFEHAANPELGTPGIETVTVIEFDIDDMTGEEVALAADRLRGVTGVLDLSIGLRQGKKGRAMHGFRLLVRPDAADLATQRCFIETATIGLRLHEEKRVLLPRETVLMNNVAVKRVRRPGGVETVKVESDALTEGDGLEARRLLKHRSERDALS
ncbi:MAG TPA: LarC family nickel insertion protein [Stellaceae bacterium]|nr:LarC family nickel insertion protein [Stellaceae bacterium]